MINRLLLLFLFCATYPVYGKINQYYFPILGYTLASNPEQPNLSNSFPSSNQGMQLGLVGYRFSKDYSIEIQGLGFLEKLELFVTPKPTQEKKEEICKTPLTAPTSITAKAPDKSLHLSSDDCTYNPWSSPQKQQDHSIIQSTLDQSVNIELTPGNTSEDIQPRQMPTSHTVSIPFIGASFSSKCTLLHIIPNLNCYYSPGLTILYPCSDLSAVLYPTFGVGARFNFYSNFVLDISYTKILTQWKKQGYESFFYADKLHFTKICLQWNR